MKRWNGNISVQTSRWWMIDEVIEWIVDWLIDSSWSSQDCNRVETRPFATVVRGDPETDCRDGRGIQWILQICRFYAKEEEYSKSEFWTTLLWSVNYCKLICISNQKNKFFRILKKKTYVTWIADLSHTSVRFHISALRQGVLLIAFGTGKITSLKSYILSVVR